MLEGLADFGNFKIQYKPGKDMQAADGLSRIPWNTVRWNSVKKFTDSVMPVEPYLPETIDWVKVQTEDADLRLLKQWLQQAKPSRDEAKKHSPALRSYWASYEQFEIQDDIVCRLWVSAEGVPDLLLKVVLEALHSTML